MQSAKRFNLANLCFRKCLEIDPEYSIALNSYAQNLRLNCKNYRDAIEVYSKLIHVDPSFKYVFFRRGICKGSLRDFRGQYIDYTHHIVFSQPLAIDYVSRALVGLKLGCLEAVISDCQIALTLDQNSQPAKKLLGEAENALRSKLFFGSYT